MNKSYLVAFLFAAAVVGWIVSGQVDADGAQPEAGEQKVAVNKVETEAPAKVESVRVRILKAQPHRREVVLRGHTEAVRWVSVKAEIDGRVMRVVAKKGDRVKAGALIAQLDMRDRQERLGEAKALVRQRKLEYAAATALSKKGYRAETKLAASKTQLETALTQVTRIELEIERTEISAPFAGVIEKRNVEVGDFLKIGNPIATIVDQDPYLVVGQVSEREVGYLKLGQPATAKLITGLEVKGKIRFIAVTADGTTRTFRVEIQVPNPKRNLRDGVTAHIRIPVDEISAHLISPAAMTLNDEGIIGVKLVDLDGIVHFAPAHIIADSNKGVWLAGLPDQIAIITVGQEFVRDGDKVNAVPEAGPSS